MKSIKGMDSIAIKTHILGDMCFYHFMECGIINQPISITQS
jgi:hypothetical protein